MAKWKRLRWTAFRFTRWARMPSESPWNAKLINAFIRVVQENSNEDDSAGLTVWLLDPREHGLGPRPGAGADSRTQRGDLYGCGDFERGDYPGPGTRGSARRGGGTSRCARSPAA